MNSSIVVGIIRTYVPLVVAVLVGWLASLGIVVSDDARSALVTGIGAIGGALYYAGVRLLEQRWPFLGLLLGAAKAPTYIDESGNHVDPPVVPPTPITPSGGSQ
jgi:hypothetical protein